MNDYRTFLTRWRLPLFFFLLASFMGSANADTAVNKTWSEPEVLAHSTLDVAGFANRLGTGSPKIITNKSGKAFAVWAQYDSAIFDDSSSSSSTIKYSHWSAYFDGNRWQRPMKIKGINPSVGIAIPEIIFDDSGHVLAAWTELSGANINKVIVLTSRFNSFNRRWESPIQLAYDGQTIGDVKIISRNNGKIHLIWEYGSSTEYLGIVSSVFNGSSWNNPIPLELDSRFRKLRDLVFSNYNNDIMVSFTEGIDEYPNAKEALFKKYFDGTNWSPRQRLSTAIYIDGVRTAFDNNGNAITVWRDIGLEEDGYPYQILASHFDRRSRSWSNPVPISVDNIAGNPEIAIDDNGNAVVVWNTGGKLWVNYFDGRNWDSPVLINSTNNGGYYPDNDMSNYNISFDRNNHAHVTWTKRSDGDYTYWIKHFDGQNWGASTPIDPPQADNFSTKSDLGFERRGFSLVDVAVDGNGNAHALWKSSISTGERESISTPFNITTTQTIWTSQLKTHSPIMIQQALVYTPYGGLVLLFGENFMDFVDGMGYSIVDENGNKPVALYVWQDNFVAALFDENPENVTVKTPFDEKTIPLEKY